MRHRSGVTRPLPKIAIALLAAMVLLIGACGSDEEADPAGVLEAYIDAYNAGDIDAVMAVFVDESVVIGHPFDSEARGLTEIRAVLTTDIGLAATTDAYSISNVEVTGNAVTWDQVWTSAGGTRYCAEGHSFTVGDGKMMSWTWAEDHDCP